MYDFVAHQALAFYGREEVAVSRPIGAFEIEADSPVFGTVEEFLAWKPESEDQGSPKFRALGTSAPHVISQILGQFLSH